MKAKITSVVAFGQRVQVKFFLKKEDIEALGGHVPQGKTGALARTYLERVVWDAWVSSSFGPSAMRPAEFEADGLEFHENENPQLSGWWEIIGFVPTGVEDAKYGTFDTLEQMSKDKTAPKPRGFLAEATE